MPMIVPAVASFIAFAAADLTGSAVIGAFLGNAILAIGPAALFGGALVAGQALMGVKHHVGGTQVDFVADPQAGIPYAMGRTGTGGAIVFADVTGVSNKDLTYVTVLSGAGPINLFESFQANTSTVTFSGEAVTSSPYSGKMWAKTQLGGPSLSALTLSTGPTPPTEWGSAQKLSGYGAFLWTLEYDSKKYPTGTPKPLWIIHGVNVYDPRLDGTYPGGSGSQRSNDETTWAYSENPFLHALTWALGRKQNGKHILGLGAPISAIDVAAFVNGANVADANGWKCGGVVSTTDSKWDVFTAILQAGSGTPLKLGAKISCMVNTPLTSLATLTAADVIGDVSIGATQSRRTRVNAIWPRYREETAGWQITPTGAPVVVSSYVTEDGEQRTKEIEYSLCQQLNQAYVLARYDIENGREFGPLVFPCKPIWLGYKPGDAITVNEPEYGLNNQKVLILDRQLDPATMTVTLTCRSETDGKHAFALGQTGSAPPTPGITGFDPTVLGAPGAVWTITGSTFSGDGQSPCIIIDGASDNPYATSIVVDVRERLTPTPTWGPWATFTFPSSATRLVITAVKDGHYYDAQVRYKTNKGVEGAIGSGLDLGVVQVAEIKIANQGLLATLDKIEAAQLGAAIGKNCLVDTNFTQGLVWYRATGDAAVTGATGLVNGVSWASVTNVGGSVGQHISFTSENQLNSLPIQPGDWIEVSIFVSAAHCSSLVLSARWLDGTGHNPGGVPTASTLQTITSTAGGGGELDTYTRIGGFAQAPSGVYRVELQLIGTIASGGTASMTVTCPMVAKALAGNDTLTAWNPGFLGEPGADVTGNHNAASITGQGSLATLNNVDVTNGSQVLNAGPWASYTSMNPGIGMAAGKASVVSTSTLSSSSSSTSIDMAGHTVWMPGGGSSTPSAVTISGLTADTQYNVFRPPGSLAYTAQTGDAHAYFTSTSGYLYEGGQRTQKSGGGFSPPIPLPAGAGFATGITYDNF